MNESGLTGSDALAVMANDRGNGYPTAVTPVYYGNNGGMFGTGGDGALWFLALLLMNGGNWGNRGNGVSEGELAASQAAQTTQLQMSQLLSGQQSNLFEIANMFSNQNLNMQEQNNANLINAIQGFNSVTNGIMNQTNVLSTQIQQLSAQMNECCCDIKTQMLQDRLTDTQARLVTAQNAIDNANQSQYILGQLGRFVAWAGSGSPTTVATS